ncbi:hypothetical protein [Celeribacter naphthalenivorans]|uniref:hypothetical protein n=1 Tax=Celeribacter naphthalenivorans TaxID=1614694 RepID=UPI001CFB612A|nr:hypothetical protein [Celeribacter naphthalenivorans]
MRYVILALVLAGCVSKEPDAWTASPERMSVFAKVSALCEMYAENGTPMPMMQHTMAPITVTSNYGATYTATQNPMGAGMSNMGAAIGYRAKIDKNYERCMIINGYSKDEGD